MERVRFIEYKNQRILKLDFSGCNTEEILVVIKEATGVIRSQPEKSVLTLTKTDRAKFDADVIKAMKEFTKGNEPYVKAAAIVGIQGLQKIILDTVSFFSKREFGVYEDVEEAKEYLLEKSGD